MARKSSTPQPAPRGRTLYEKLRAQYPAREQVIAYFQEKFPGKVRGREEWKQRLVDAIQPYTQGKNGQPLSRASLNRRFEKDTKTGKPRYLGKMTPQTQREYEELAEALHLGNAPKGGYRITGTMYIMYSDCEPVEDIEFELHGKNAEEFTRNPSIQGLVNVYNREPYGKKTNVVEPCQEETGASLHVEVIE